MSQSLANIIIHVIFSTKFRKPLILPEIRSSLYNYLGGTILKLNSYLHEIGGIEDHVHLLLSLSRTMSASQLVEEIKKSSTKWIKTQGTSYQNFAWQKGYGAFSVSQSNLDSAKVYIQNQDEHHKKITFENEYRRFLTQYNIPFDERYVWD